MLRQLVKKEKMMRIFSSSYDSAVMKRVLATHAPDGREVDLEPLLAAIEETFRHAVPADFDSVIIITGAHSGNIHALPGDYKQVLLGFDDIIHTVSCELTCKCSGGTDAHVSTLAILNMLSSYSWEDKLVISLGAFAIIFGKFWLVAQFFATHPLAKSIALLKHMPNVIEHYKILKARFDAINHLIKAMLDVTKCIVTFKNLPHQYIQDYQPPKSTATTDHIPTATYWSIKSMVACTSQLTSLLGMNYEYITATSAACELSSLTHKVHNIHEHLKSILVRGNQNIDEKQQEEYHPTRTQIVEAQNEEETSINLARTLSDIVVSHRTQTREEVRSHKEIKASGSVISHSQSMTDSGSGFVISHSQSMSGSGSGSVISHSKSMVGSGSGSVISHSQSMSGSGSGSVISHSKSMTGSGSGSGFLISHSKSMTGSDSVISNSESMSGSGSAISHSQSMTGSGSLISHSQNEEQASINLARTSSDIVISHRTQTREQVRSNKEIKASSSVISHSQSISGSGSGSDSVISHNQSMSGSGSSSLISHSQSMNDSRSVISHSQSMSGFGSGSGFVHSQSMNDSGSLISNSQSMTSSGSIISYSQSMSGSGSVILYSKSMTDSGFDSLISHSQSMSGGSGSVSVISHSQSMTRVVRSSSLQNHTTDTTSH